MPVRVTYVYANPRRELAAEVAAGKAADTTLHGQNHLAELGFGSSIHDPRRGHWHLREVALPWELHDADVVLSVLWMLFPLAARARPRLRVLVLNFGVNLIYARSDRRRRSLLRSSLKSAAGVVCLGESQRERLEEQTGARGTTALLGIDERYFAPRAAPTGTGEPYVLGAEVHRGRLSELRYRVERALVHLRVGLLAGQRACSELIS